MSLFAVIDTETTWSGRLMTAGILIAESDTFKVIDHRYFVIKEALVEGGMYDYVIHVKGLEEKKVSDKNIGNEIYDYLKGKNVASIYAYNANFDKNCLPYLSMFKWHDIMRLAAYKQYNSAIPETAPCCKTGRLKSGYGVENIMKMFGKNNYFESHNALIDARDELEIMKLLGHALEVYPEI